MEMIPGGPQHESSSPDHLLRGQDHPDMHVWVLFFHLYNKEWSPWASLLRCAMTLVLNIMSPITGGHFSGRPMHSPLASVHVLQTQDQAGEGNSWGMQPCVACLHDTFFPDGWRQTYLSPFLTKATSPSPRLTRPKALPLPSFPVC
jgi:hypothetical protein